MAHPDNAPWVWQATGLFDRMKDGTLTIVDLAEVLRCEFERGKSYAAADHKAEIETNWLKMKIAKRQRGYE